jgi:Uma2 family endonuclease
METVEETLSEYEIERKKPIPSLIHGIVQANLIFEIKLRYRTIYTVPSELNLALSDWDSVPDVCIYPKMEINVQRDVIAMTEPPLAVIEILSPTQSLQTLVDKAHKYFSLGVQSCWLVLPSLKNIYVFSDQENYEIYRESETLVDNKLNISFPLTDVFK